MKKILFAFVLFSAVFTACQKDPIKGKHPDCFPDNPSSCERLITSEAPEDKVTTAQGTNILKSWIEGNDLKLEVGYSGCNKHTFDLHLNENFVNHTKDLPTTLLQLADNQGEQFCQAYFTEILCFDLSPLKSGSHGEINIALQNHENVKLVYRY